MAPSPEEDTMAYWKQKAMEYLEEVKRLTRKVAELEDENDLLVLTHQDLKEKIKKLQDPQPTETETAKPVPTGPSTLFPSSTLPLSHLLINGDGNYPSRLLASLPLPSGTDTNPLCCRIHTLPTNPPLHLILTGAVGGTVGWSLVGAEGREESQGKVWGFSGPVLALSVSPCGAYVVAGCMDGSLGLMNVVEEEEGGRVVGVTRVLGTIKAHAKHVVALKWSPDGTQLASASHDKTVNLFAFNKPPEAPAFVTLGQGGEEGSQPPEPPKEDGWLTCVRTLNFTGPVEAMEFYRPEEGPPGGGGGSQQPDSWLIISSRGVPFLTYFNTTSFDRRDISINDAAWDTHVSFTILSLALSPDKRWLLAGTDKSRLIIYPVGGNKQMRDFYGHNHDEFFNTRAVWDASGRYVLASSQVGGHVLVVWEVANEKVVAKLEGHSHTIRDLTSGGGAVVSVSYDRTLKLWGPPN